MLSLSDLEDVVAAQSQRITGDNTFPRLLLEQLELIPDFALIISGIRRCGKSTLLGQLMQKRTDTTLFINFDTPKLYNFEFSDFRLLDELIKAKPEVNLLFFDEIQVVENWEIYVRGKLDEGYKVVITGSNASLLSRELGTKLTGRHLSKELFPFSYREFCAYKSQAESEGSLLNYLHIGGFPQFVNSENPDILAALVNDILYRDITVRHGIRDDKPLKNLLMFVVANVGNLISANKLRSVIGVKSTATVLEYLTFLEDVYLIHLVPKFAYSYKKQLVNPRKVYFIDNGLQTAITPSFTEDVGRKFENLVFWEFRRYPVEIYYFNENDSECDFVICKNHQPIALIQVCAKLHVDNQRREQDGLWEAMRFFGMEEGFIITLNQADTIVSSHKTIHVIPMHQLDLKKMMKV